MVATNSINENKKKYFSCRKNMFKLLPGRLIHSDVSLKSKLGMMSTKIATKFTSSTRIVILLSKTPI